MNRDATSDFQLSAFEKMVASRMVISLNDFSDQPVTELTSDLKQLIQQTEVAGVILFASNFVSIEQTIKLTHDLQSARAEGELPLLISTDQEGGRVTRLPSDFATTFTGNMAIGATYPSHGVEFAHKVGAALARELCVLGINVNFAPTLDANTNPDNPVINVRSFGENSHTVTDLGSAMVEAIQKQGVAAAIKHFPGHGDTDIDSHTGLPRVDRSLDELIRTDLLPFKEVCKQAQPAMVMTAHIQYPEIDSTTLTSKNNTSMIVPATMSRQLLQRILREQLQFDGVIITDALDMAGVADHFDPVTAVVETFKAGADIALMPFKDKTKDCVLSFKQFIHEVAKRLSEENLSEEEMQHSCQRVQQLRVNYSLDELSLPAKISQAEAIFADNKHHLLEAYLAANAITLLGDESALPLTKDNSIVIVANDMLQANLLLDEVASHIAQANHITTRSWSEVSATDYKDIDTRILLVDYGYHSPVLEKPEAVATDFASTTQQKIAEFLESDGVNIVVAMQSPYDIADYVEQSDAALFCYHGVLSQNKNTFSNSALSALAEVLVGEKRATGTLPVTLKRGD